MALLGGPVHVELAELSAAFVAGEDSEHELPQAQVVVTDAAWDDAPPHDPPIDDHDGPIYHDMPDFDPPYETSYD